jgi:molybdopterin/thiamine biosynthesis adenylyltransferase
VGSNRAEASLEKLQQLNPMVKVIAEKTNISEAPESFFDAFDVVVVTGQTKDVLVKINALCRTKGIKFFCGDIFGFFGFSFMDLDDHEFIEEVLEVVYSHKLSQVRTKHRRLCFSGS